MLLGSTGSRPCGRGDALIVWVAHARSGSESNLFEPHADRRHLSFPLFTKMNLPPVRHRFDEPASALETHQPH